MNFRLLFYKALTTFLQSTLYSTFHVEISCNLFSNKPWFLSICSKSLLETLWEKEKLLVTSNFSFSNSVFYSFEELSDIFIHFWIVVCKLFQFGRVQNLSFRKGLKCISNFYGVLHRYRSRFPLVQITCFRFHVLLKNSTLTDKVFLKIWLKKWTKCWSTNNFFSLSHNV